MTPFDQWWRVHTLVRRAGCQPHELCYLRSRYHHADQWADRYNRTELRDCLRALRRKKLVIGMEITDKGRDVVRDTGQQLPEVYQLLWWLGDVWMRPERQKLTLPALFILRFVKDEENHRLPDTTQLASITKFSDRDIRNAIASLMDRGFLGIDRILTAKGRRTKEFISSNEEVQQV